MDKNIWIWTFTAISVNCTAVTTTHFFFRPKCCTIFAFFFLYLSAMFAKLFTVATILRELRLTITGLSIFLKILMYSLNLVKGGYLQLASAVRRKYSFCRRSLHNSSITSLRGCQFQLINYGIASL